LWFVVVKMWLLLLTLFGLIGCSLITLIFGLMRAGRRADEGEEKILEIMSPASRESITEDSADAQTQHAPMSASTPKAPVAK
jgi:hypothetical protein